MRVLILEGIATSGKSTVISELRKALKDSKVIVAKESDTHEPIMEQKTEIHIDFFKSLINRFAAKTPALLIFDRLYLTQAFRAKGSVEDYSELEELLSGYSSLTIFLKVDESAIQDRISKAAVHRSSGFFKSRGSSRKEIAQYYINQQRALLELLKHSKIPYKTFDTTNANYPEVAQEIIKLIWYPRQDSNLRP